jgi:hypothetical protein
MRYRVTITEIRDPAGSGPSTKEVFNQSFDCLDIREAAIAINEAAIASEEKSMKLGKINFPTLTPTKP